MPDEVYAMGRVWAHLRFILKVESERNKIFSERNVWQDFKQGKIYKDVCIIKNLKVNIKIFNKIYYVNECPRNTHFEARSESNNAQTALEATTREKYFKCKAITGLKERANN